jgi:hypothetical protein
MYQAGPQGQAGRGRGNFGARNSPGGRGGQLNAGAPHFNPQGQSGIKRPREEGSTAGTQQGNNGKRPRGAGQAS